MYLHHHQRAGFKVGLSSGNASLDYMSSRYCLAPPGGGWGKRGERPVSGTAARLEHWHTAVMWGPCCCPACSAYGTTSHKDQHTHGASMDTATAQSQPCSQMCTFTSHLWPTTHATAAAGIVAALYGCTPLLLTDHLHEAFEPELTWASFALRLPQALNASLHLALAGQSRQQVERRQVGLAGRQAALRAAPQCHHCHHCHHLC